MENSQKRKKKTTKSKKKNKNKAVSKKVEKKEEESSINENPKFNINELNTNEQFKNMIPPGMEGFVSAFMPKISSMFDGIEANLNERKTKEKKKKNNDSNDNEEEEKEEKMKFPSVYKDEEIKEPEELSERSVVSKKSRDIRQKHVIYDGFNKKILECLEMLSDKLPHNKEKYKRLSNLIESTVKVDKTKPMSMWKKLIADPPGAEPGYIKNLIKNFSLENAEKFLEATKDNVIMRALEAEKNKKYFKPNDWKILFEELNELLFYSDATEIANPELMTNIQEMAEELYKTRSLDHEKMDFNELKKLVGEAIFKNKKVMSGIQDLVTDIIEKAEESEEKHTLPVPDSFMRLMQKFQNVE